MLKALEKRYRELRDRTIFAPLSRSRHVRKHLPVSGDIALFDIGDHMVAVDPYDGIASWIRDKRGWFREETMRIFEAMPKKGGIFIDVGANIGTQTIYALKHGGFNRVICIEPDPRNLRILKVNMTVNGLSDRVTIIEAGAGGEPGTAELSLTYRNGLTNSMAEKRGGESLLVPVVRIEDQLKRLGVQQSDIGLAWIDVEGFEGEVLKGWPSLPGTQVCIEYTPNVRALPPNAFSAWSRWANARLETIQWRPITELDLPLYDSQVDLLLA